MLSIRNNVNYRSVLLRLSHVVCDGDSDTDMAEPIKTFGCRLTLTKELCIRWVSIYPIGKGTMEGA